jgi:hypothetical protein
MTYGRIYLISFIVDHNVYDDVLVLVVIFKGVEESSIREASTSDIEACPSSCVQTLEL